MGELLRSRRFTLIWGGQSISFFGDWVRNMALTYWVYEISGHSPVATAAVMVAEYFPMIVLAPFAGVFVDRWSRRRTMLWTQVISAGLSLSFLAALPQNAPTAGGGGMAVIAGQWRPAASTAARCSGRGWRCWGSARNRDRVNASFGGRGALVCWIRRPSRHWRRLWSTIQRR